MIRIYLAHPIGTYGSIREQRAIALLQAHGHCVINPHEAQYGKACGSDMKRWTRLAAACDALALLPYSDGKLGIGTRLELQAAQAAHRPIALFHRSGERFEWVTRVNPRLFLDMETTVDRNRRLKSRPGWQFHAPDTLVHADLLKRVHPQPKVRRPTPA
jgi:hypothetical protein